VLHGAAAVPTGLQGVRCCRLAAAVVRVAPPVEQRASGEAAAGADEGGAQKGAGTPSQTQSTAVHSPAAAAAAAAVTGQHPERSARRAKSCFPLRLGRQSSSQEPSEILQLRVHHDRSYTDGHGPY
jgi:hypothetical protein